MCQLEIGQQVTLTGRKFCKKCGQMISAQSIGATFIGHDSGFDVFDADNPITCPWCSTVNDAFEMPCSDPIELPALFTNVNKPVERES